jgi:hypothetical protein
MGDTSRKCNSAQFSISFNNPQSLGVFICGIQAIEMGRDKKDKGQIEGTSFPGYAFDESSV